MFIKDISTFFARKLSIKSKIRLKKYLKDQIIQIIKFKKYKKPT